jgi:hypothetical protein
MRLASTFGVLFFSSLVTLVIVGSSLTACTTETIAAPTPTTDDAGAATDPADGEDAGTSADAGNKKDSGKPAAACNAHGGTCDDDQGCCSDAPFCSPTGSCCMGQGAKKNGASCANGDACCSGACDTSRGACCAYDGQACGGAGECCPGFECGSNGKCGLTVGADCAGGKQCAYDLLCADKVKKTGFSSSTTEPNKCCVPGGELCGTSEDCCIESSSITGVQCYQGRCQRSYGSSCAKDEQCTYKCVDGKCN